MTIHVRPLGLMELSALDRVLAHMDAQLDAYGSTDLSTLRFMLDDLDKVIDDRNIMLLRLEHAIRRHYAEKGLVLEIFETELHEGFFVLREPTEAEAETAA